MEDMLVDTDLLLVLTGESGFNMRNQWFTEYNPLPKLSVLGFEKTDDGKLEHPALKIGARIKNQTSQGTSKDWTTCDIEHYDKSETVAFLYHLDNPKRIMVALVYSPQENQALLVSNDIQNPEIEILNKLLETNKS